MTFSSISFLFFFLPLFMAAYCLTPGIAGKNAVTLAFSLLFYAWGEPRFVLVLLGSIGFNLLAALLIDAREGRSRGVVLTVAVTVNLAMLAACKYADFLAGNLNILLDPLGKHLALPGLPLPLGVSFFTFHCLSYLIDVYRRRLPANRRPLELALYIALIPQLIAGPIVRYLTIARQLRHRRHSLMLAACGARIFIIGLGQKVLVADQVAPLSEQVFDHTPHAALPDAWLGLLAYTVQIYFDFAGYSNMAIGLGICLGFTFPRNFRLPYTAVSVTEFWRRWHMSLSSWMRDYLYIPLGGSRGRPWQTYRNLVVVFLLCGLWHGASWNFVLWGAWHGGFLIAERAALNRLLARLPGLAGWAYTMLAVMGGWVLFRAHDAASALDFAASLAGLNGSNRLGFYVHLALTPLASTALIVGSILAIAPRWKHRYRLNGPRPAVILIDATWTFGLLVLCTMCLASGSYSPFLYFRF